MIAELAVEDRGQYRRHWPGAQHQAPAAASQPVALGQIEASPQVLVVSKGRDDNSPTPPHSNPLKIQFDPINLSKTLHGCSNQLRHPSKRGKPG